MKKISIIIPAYNCEKYLELCLNSIVKEMDETIELIVINDGSKDNTLSICKKYENENVKIISNSNHGVSYSRNEGIEKATGKYVMFVDADDYMSKGWAKKVLNAIKTDKDVYYFVNADVPNDCSKTKILDCIFGLGSYTKWLSTPWSKLYKRKLLENDSILFNDKVTNGEDMLFNANVILKAQDYEIIKDSIYNYRICNTSLTKSFNSKIFESDIRFQENLIKIENDNNIQTHKYSNHCIQNAIIMFIRKMSMVKIHKINDYSDIFNKEPYLTYLKENKHYESLRNKIIITLVKIRLQKLAIIIFKLVRTIKKQKTYDYIIEI